MFSPRYSIYSHSLKELEISFPIDAEKDSTVLQIGAVNCKKLELIKITSKVTKLSSYIFRNNPKLEEVQLPDTVNTIGEGVFYECYELNKINLDKVELFDSKAFVNTGFKTFDFSHYKYNYIPEELLHGCIKLKQVTGTDNITYVSSKAFRNCTSLEEISFKNLTLIDSEAFYNCSSLKSFEFSTVLAIGIKAFCYCESLESITISHLIFFGQSSEAGIFENCTSLKKADLTGLITIDNYFFQGCESLTEVIYNPNIYSFGTKTFARCGFKEFTIPDTVSVIGEKCFSGCESLKKIIIGKRTTSLTTSWFDPTDHTLTFSIPDTVFTIGTNAFDGIDKVEIEFTDNKVYDYKDQSLINKIDNSLVVTAGILSKVFKVPEEVISISNNAITRRYSAKESKSKRRLDLKDASDKIASAAIVKVQTNLLAMNPQSIIFQSFCYDGDMFVTDEAYISSFNIYTNKDYLYDTFGKTDTTGGGCSTKLNDAFKWRHIIGWGGAEIGLLVVLLLLIIALIIVLLLYFLKPLGSVGGGGGDSGKKEKKKEKSSSSSKSDKKDADAV